MKETWKQVVGYEGLYEVSDRGRVRSLDRIDSLGRLRKGRVLSANIISQGKYLGVGLSRDGTQKTFHVHVLVIEAFIGPRPEGVDVCHGPNGKMDNSVGNLSYKSRRENSGEDRNRDNVYSSRFPGVCWHKRQRKWQVSMKVLGKTKHFGVFDDELEAAEAYKIARKNLTIAPTGV